MPVYTYDSVALINALKSLIDFFFTSISNLLTLFNQLANFISTNVTSIKNYLDANSYAVTIFKDVYGAIPSVITNIFFLGMIIYILFRVVRAL